MPEKFPPPLESERARQGETSGHMRLVLIISFIGAAVILAALVMWWSKHGPAQPPAAVAAPAELGLAVPAPRITIPFA